MDSSITMAAKAELRNHKPVILAVATNDGLGNSAGNIGRLMAVRHLYFVPMGQDDPVGKPESLIAHFDRIEANLESALSGKQLQPIYSTR